MKDEERATTSVTRLGAIKRFWYYLVFFCIGLKWTLKELFSRHRKVDPKSTPARSGETAVITGGARGIGLEVVKRLLSLDMNVVIGVRDEAKGNQAIEKIRKEGITQGYAEVLPLDLKSLRSVRKFADKVLALPKCSKINLLINNAGIMATPYVQTEDSFESQFQVNYLGHFCLTELLVERLASSGTPTNPSRIINVSSAAATGGSINFKDLSLKNGYSEYLAYMNSKLMQIIYTAHLNGKLAGEKKNVNVYSVHPGVVKTDLHKTMCIYKVFGCCLSCFYKSPVQGCEGIIYVALSPKVLTSSGSFYANCVKQSLPKIAKDSQKQQELFKQSSQLIAASSNDEMSPHSIMRTHQKGNGSKRYGRVRKVSFASARGDSICSVSSAFHSIYNSDGDDRSLKSIVDSFSDGFDTPRNSFGEAPPLV